MTDTSASLLERLRQPFNADARARFVSLYTPLISAWGRRVGLQESDAAALVQEVFVTLVRVLPTFAYDRDRGFRRWLRTVTLNAWRNGRRAGGRLATTAADPDAIAGPSDLDELWESEYRKHLAALALTVMRADFQPTTWRACWETVVAGRPAAEVAAEFGLTVGAVYAAKFRVLQRLREELAGLLD